MSIEPQAHTGQPVRIADVSLRDGEQGIDAAFSAEEKERLAHLLAEIGVPIVQVGFPAHDADTVRRLKASGIKSLLEVICLPSRSGWRGEIEAAVSCEADIIHFSQRVRAETVRATGGSLDEILRRCDEAVTYAKALGAPRVVFGASHVVGTPTPFATRLYAKAAESGADELVINDSLGCARPTQLADLVHLVSAVGGLPVGVHCHNDFGLAVANSLAAVQAGATRVDVCVNGIGERAGNTALEEIVVCLELLAGTPTGLELSRLTELSAVFADVLRTALPSNKAIVGRNVFAQKIDAHVEVAISRPDLVEPFDPAAVGNARSIALGKGSGPVSVRHRLNELGVHDVPDHTVADLVKRVWQLADTTKRAVSDDALLADLDRLSYGW